MLKYKNTLFRISISIFKTQISNKFKLPDLTVTVIDNKLDFGINRKPNQIDNVLPNNFNHPYSQKMSYFNWYFIGLNIFHLANIINNTTSTLSMI